LSNTRMELALVDGKLQPLQPGLRGTCEECGEELRAHCRKGTWYWQHPKLSPICHAEDLKRVGLTYEQWEAGIRPAKRR
jgi:hypothetical protein